MANIPSWAKTNRTMLETDILTKDEQAETKKEDGNQQYKLKNYKDALTLYSEAIDLCPENASYYGNRAACQMMLNRYKQALEDARQAVKLDESFAKGYIREAKCHIALGDAASALRSLEKGRILDPNSPTIETELNNANQLHQFEEEAKKAYEKQDYRKVVYCMDRALSYSVACSNFKLIKAECLAFLGRHDDASEIANDMLQRDNFNADAIYVRGMCLYYQDNIDKAFQHFQKVLKLAPDHQKAQEIYKRAKQLKAKKDVGNDAFKSGRFQEAYDIYTQALFIDPKNVVTNAKIYFNRATVCSRLNKLNEALKDCNEAISLDATYEKAYLRRAKCYLDMEMFEEAVRDYEILFEMSKKAEYKQLLRDAKKELKKSKRKDYYKILGIEKNASVDDIRKAYRKRALDHHPDRHANATDDIKREQEKKFKEVGEAYGILSDPKKRTRYDNGHDLNENEGFSDIDPNNIFQAFFGGPGHFSFETNNAPPGGFHQFPGGFSFQFA